MSGDGGDTNKSLFDSLDPPPADHDGNILQWNHSDWHKLGGGQYGRYIGEYTYLYSPLGRYVSLREVRENIFDCLGYWPTLDETNGVPKLLDHRNFVKYNYHVHTKEEWQASDPPEEYVAIGFEEDEGGRKAWLDTQLQKRFHRQYCRTGPADLPDCCLSEEDLRIKGATPDVNSSKNQEYIFYVKACRPDLIEELFQKGTDGLCPNCFEKDEGVPMNYRSGVVAHALENVFGRRSGASEQHHAKAIECLRLVCSLNGVDVNADTWFTSARAGPPLNQAAKRFDVEAARILLDAGARPTFPDSFFINGDQWCNLLRPFEYKDANVFKTALLSCVRAIDEDTNDKDVCNMLKLLLEAGNAEDVLARLSCVRAIGEDMNDKDVCNMLKLLFEAGNVDDVLARMRLDPNDDDLTMTASQILSHMGQAYKKEFPLSTAVLTEAENRVVKTEYEYKPGATHSNLEDGNWAGIADVSVEMQKCISRYMDIYQWARLKRTSKRLSSWPKPPSPSIDYHLVMFYISDQRCTAYFGFAKTLADAVEAFKSRENTKNGKLTNFAYRFIKIGGLANQPVIPLLQYRHTENMESSSADELSQIHPDGKLHFGVEEAGRCLPEKSVVKRWMSGYSEGWLREDKSSYNGVGFDRDDFAGTCVWFNDAKPSVDIDLRHLWHTKGKFNDGGEDDVDMEEIWLNEEQAKTWRSYFSYFRFGNNDSWAVCKKSTYIRSTWNLRKEGVDVTAYSNYGLVEGAFI